MQFLIDANMPRRTCELIRNRNHVCVDVRDVNMADASDAAIAALAQRDGYCIITRDLEFGHVRVYPPAKYAGIVVFEFPPTSQAAFILQVLENFLDSDAIVQDLAGCLAIVRPGHVRLRP